MFDQEARKISPAARIHFDNGPDTIDVKFETGYISLSYNPN